MLDPRPAPHRPPSPATPRPTGAPARPRPFTVAEVMAQVRTCFEEQFRPVLVVGEVADLRRPRGGHVYFTLRDPSARLRVVVLADVADGLEPFKDGDEVLVRGKITAYAPSGDVQLQAAAVDLAGEGAQRRKREALAGRLRGEGLFDPARKRPLPFAPLRVGVCTSPTGAALRDVLTTIERRFPVVVVLAPVPVHSAAAAPEIAAQLRALDARGRVDVILLVRGGGSREDLAAFDEEVVVRAVAACRTPVVTGIGHETDTTLVDLVADRRAPTPTAAAELVVPVRRDLVAELDRRAVRLRAAVEQRAAAARRRLDAAARSHALQATAVRVARLGARLDAAGLRLEAQRPAERVARWRELVAAADARLGRALAARTAAAAAALDLAGARLAGARPEALVAAQAEQVALLGARLAAAAPDLGPRAAALEALGDRLAAAARARTDRRAGDLAAAAGRLGALSPLQVLARGYSLTTRDGAVVDDAAGLAPGDLVRTRLARGSFEARVERVDPA